LFFEDLR